MAIGVYKVPREFKDEDKWFRFFTKIQLFIMGIGIALSALVFLICSVVKMYRVATVITVINLIVCALLAFFKMPENKYMYGGGYPAYQILLRLIKKHFLDPKQVYIREFDREEIK